MGVMEEPVQKGCRDDAVAQQLAPVTEIFVACKDDAPSFVPVGNDTEKDLGLAAVELHIANFIDDQQRRLAVSTPSAA